jgi:hypothetical protein
LRIASYDSSGRCRRGEKVGALATWDAAQARNMHVDRRVPMAIMCFTFEHHVPLADGSPHTATDTSWKREHECMLGTANVSVVVSEHGRDSRGHVKVVAPQK